MKIIESINSCRQKSSSRLSLKLTATVVLACFFAFASGQPLEVKQAFHLIDIEQPSKGIASLQKIANSAANQYYLGLAYMRTGDKEKALAAFEKGIPMDEKNFLNMVGKGHVKFSEKKLTEAKVLFDRALAGTKQKDPNILKAVAEAYLSDSKFVVDAINLLNKAKAINSTDPEVHLLLGDAYMMQNKGGESVSSYERAVSADAKNAKGNYKVAKVYERSKNTEMVKEYLNKAVTADPEFAPAWKELAEVYYVDKKADKAIEAAETYMRVTEKKEEAKCMIAFASVMAKKFDQANATFKSVISNPNAPVIAFKFYAYSLIEEAKAKNDTTKQTALKIKDVFDQYFKKVNPVEITATDHALYAGVVLNLKLTDLALQSFEQSLKLDSTQVDILQQKASAEYKADKYDEAIKSYRRLMKVRSQPLAMDHYYLGMSYYLTNQYLQADTMFTKLSEMQPKVVHGYLWSAKSRANIDATGERGLAIPAYMKFIEIASLSPDKNKKDLIEAYYYVAGYHVRVKNNADEGVKNIEKILQLDPKHKDALAFMKALKEE
jgi:tetratricopeptide (TPR) repeat protein